jgi:copper transport protein
MTRPRVRRGMAGVLLAVAVAAVLLLGPAGPAAAHATLVSTDPAQGEVLQEAPERVVFTFDEAVRGVPDAVRVFDAEGVLVPATATVRGAELEVVPDEPLGDGTTVIAWRVVSEDGHPISGSLTFSVGAPTTGFTPPPVGPEREADVPMALTVARGVGYVGLLLATGLVVFVALVLPSRTPGARRRPVVVARWAGAVAAVAWLATLPLTGLYLLDGDAGSLARGSTWTSLPLLEYVVPAAVVLGVGLAVVLVGTQPPGPRRRAAALVAAGVGLLAPALTGHTRAATPEALVVAADALHLMVGSVWLGGLVGLALTLPALQAQAGAAAEVLSRFSTAAAGVLVALVATGSVLAWRILGSWSALLETTYGRLLLVKIGFVLVAVAIAAWNRWALLPRVQRASKRDATRVGRPVVRAVAIEAGVLVAALMITGALVDTSPQAGATAASASGPSVPTATLGDIEVSATLTPRTRGPNTITVQLRSAAGEPAEGVAPPVLRMSQGELRLGAIPVTPVVPGTYTAEVVLPTAGTWRLQVSLRVSEFANPVAVLDFEVEDAG